MNIKKTAIPGCFEIIPRIFRDHRGLLVKTFHEQLFRENDLNTSWREEYYSVSRGGVLRGLHFQRPPHDHVKMVYCAEGSVLDAVLDLRKGSPSYGRHILIELSSATGNMLYLPSGLAHGFYVTSETAVMMYKVSSVHAPDCDSGVLWNSAGIPWPDETPALSDRDARFPALENVSSPFSYRNDGDWP